MMPPLWAEAAAAVIDWGPRRPHQSGAQTGGNDTEEKQALRRIQMTLILLWLPQSKLSDNAPPFYKPSSHSLR
ncbi:hypothetical protein D9C73_000619 [Collichthys lucidus]|uniref:Uncharacterized protein n=1 Tax=Collichthys lucidus TaxID=240159 RepID=A0A4V6AM05_COLLU|nr:hypothetical protein D9C73_000619 [Collichthys lucidus]